MLKRRFASCLGPAACDKVHDVWSRPEARHWTSKSRTGKFAAGQKKLAVMDAASQTGCWDVVPAFCKFGRPGSQMIEIRPRIWGKVARNQRTFEILRKGGADGVYSGCMNHDTRCCVAVTQTLPPSYVTLSSPTHRRPLRPISRHFCDQRNQP